MPTSGDQNNPFRSPQTASYGPAPAPQSPQAQQAPPSSTSARHNPYTQPGPQSSPRGAARSAPQGPSGYGYPQPGALGTPVGGSGRPGAPSSPGASRATHGAGPGGIAGGGPGRGASGWLWAVGGAAAATAIGASVMFATGAFSGSDPDLKGYAYRDDLCADTSLTPFENAHYQAKPSSGSGSGSGPGAPSPSTPPNPQHSGSRMDAMDSMWCNVSLTPGDANPAHYSSTWVYNSVTLHRKTDPGPEFADMYRAYEKQQTSISYKVDSVSGIGDQAYLVTRNDSQGSNNSTYVILAVRDGWLTYQSTWSSYAPGNKAKPPAPSEVATMLENSAKETLKRLRG